MKRFFAAVLALCMLFSCFSVLAEEPTVITLEADQFSVAVGRAVNLKTAITPRRNLKLEWSSSDESVATVNNRGAVKGIAVGEATVTVKAVDDDTVSASCKVSVVLPVKKISFAEKSFSLAAGLSRNLAVSVEPEDATNKALVFSSSNEKVATVNEAGVITGVGKGNARITATAQDGSKVKGVINVKVEEYDMVFTSPEPQTATYYYGSGQFTVKGKVKTGCVSIPDITTTMWAMVAGGPASEEFEVTPVKPGTDTITVKAGRYKTVIKVYVSPDCFPAEEPET